MHEEIPPDEKRSGSDWNSQATDQQSNESTIGQTNNLEATRTHGTKTDLCKSKLLEQPSRTPPMQDLQLIKNAQNYMENGKTNLLRMLTQRSLPLIKKGGFTIEILPIVENSGTRTKELFLQSIKLNLNVGEKYDESSPKTRIIKMAISVYGERVKTAFSNDRIQIDGKPLTLFTYSDEVSCPYRSVGENKVMKLSLAELNPEYKGLSNVINEVAEQFEGLSASELKKNVFALEFIGKQILFEQICDLKKCPKDGSLPKMPTNLNASQILYFIWYRRDKSNWNNRFYDQSVYNSYYRRYEVQKRAYSGLWDDNWVPMVNLEAIDSSVFDNLMAICMNEKVNFYQLSFFKTIVGKYLSNSYILQEEQINATVEKWAKEGELCKEKLSYLKAIGVKDETEDLIKFRKGILNGIEQKCSDYNLQVDELVKTMEWLTSVIRDNPIEKKEAKNAVISILLTLKNADYAQFVIEDFKTAKEWEDKRYYQWKKSHNREDDQNDLADHLRDDSVSLL